MAEYRKKITHAHTHTHTHMCLTYAGKHGEEEKTNNEKRLCMAHGYVKKF